MLNKVEIIGRVGKEPEVRHTQTAIKVVNLTVAVSESWKDAQGESKSALNGCRLSCLQSRIT